MKQVALFKQDSGQVSYLVPTSEELALRNIYSIATTDIPKGKPFKIVNYEELPVDYPQEFWIVDDSELTDGIGEGR